MSCRTGKKPYRSEEQAKRALATIRTKGEQRERTPWRYYRCEHCGRFHLTAEPTRVVGRVLRDAPVPRPSAPAPDELSALRQDVAALETVVRAAIAAGCGEAMYHPEWAAYRLRHEAPAKAAS